MKVNIGILCAGGLYMKENSSFCALASQILSIPATSASSEQVFSTAGLTIKDRARLAPQTAKELIFLHDVVPAIGRL
jgi:hypothetical protein